MAHSRPHTSATPACVLRARVFGAALTTVHARTPTSHLQHALSAQTTACQTTRGWLGASYDVRTAPRLAALLFARRLWRFFTCGSTRLSRFLMNLPAGWRARAAALTPARTGSVGRVSHQPEQSSMRVLWRPDTLACSQALGGAPARASRPAGLTGLVAALSSTQTLHPCHLPMVLPASALQTPAWASFVIQANRYWSAELAPRMPFNLGNLR